MIFNLMSVIDWLGITTNKQGHVDIDNPRENARRIMHEYAVGNKVYV